MVVTIATDGSCLKNPDGPGGWAWVRDDGASGNGAHPATTNNVMELTAIKQALATHPGQDVHILSDSQYAINCLSVWCHKWRLKGWKTASGGRVKNGKLIRATLELMEGRTVTFEWVRGHNGHPLNEQADALAGLAARGVRT